MASPAGKYIPPHRRSQPQEEPTPPNKPDGIPKTFDGKKVTLVDAEQKNLQDGEFHATGVLPGKRLEADAFLPPDESGDIRLSCRQRVMLQSHKYPHIVKTTANGPQYRTLTTLEKMYLMDLEYRLVVDKEQVEKKLEKARTKAQEQKESQSPYQSVYRSAFASLLNDYLYNNKIPPVGFPHAFATLARGDNTLSYAQAMTVGGRPYQEDCSTYKHLGDEQPSLQGCHLMAVFDGHGGEECSTTASEFLPSHVMQNLLNYREVLYPDVANFNAMKTAFTDTSLQLRNQGCGYTHGSTACAVIIEGDTLVVANAGDCRALVVDGTLTTQLSTDMRACNKDYHSSVYKRFGTVGIADDEPGGPVRVAHHIEPARGLGDGQLHGYSPRPDIVRFHMPSTGNPQTLVMFSDGVSDCCTSEQVGTLVAHMRANSANESAIATMLIELCLAATRNVVHGFGQESIENYADNMTVLVTFLD
ncbi:PP2C family serine/threonine-protein phosphatase [Parendozoicomonas haliclonae]|uniref:Protein phosphatase 2C n=1 Tax=Parendozoicomonas haliclonae TaxID=1960125 RepID=A0A1X7ANF9_9GAMM|nr:PP2C family protein-serine/threonine phosphatase [Parendozoicomonas haliclonae]SMA49834.1 Protein phosphatase 2C [Parendozoicomonas haliclonae]